MNQKFSTGSTVQVIGGPYTTSMPVGTQVKVLEYRDVENPETFDPLYIVEGDWAFYPWELDFPKPVTL